MTGFLSKKGAGDSQITVHILRPPPVARQAGGKQAILAIDLKKPGVRETKGRRALFFHGTSPAGHKQHFT
jgi:hypothetical protein